MNIYELELPPPKKEISQLLKKLKELHENRKDYIPNKATEDYDFLCGVCAERFYPKQTEKDIKDMIKKYL